MTGVDGSAFGADLAEVAEAERGAAAVLEPAVDRLSRPVADVGPVEDRKHVDRAPLQCWPEASDSDERHDDILPVSDSQL